MADLTLLQLLLGTTGSGALGYLGAGVRLRTSHAATLQKRETEFAARVGEFQKRIDEEMAELREEVALCRDERTQFAIVKMGTGMLAGELRRRDPTNPTLKVVADAWAALPPEREDFASLLAKLHGGDGEEEDEKPGDA